VHLADKRFVQLATTDFPTVNPGDDANRAIGSSDLPYQKEISWDATYNDIALVDLNTGQRQKVVEHWRGAPTMSPGGKYLLYFDDSNGNWFTHRIADGARVNLTEKLGVNFWREDHDTPNVPPPYGSAGWTADDRSVLLYDKYDVWEIRPDGTGARMITGGEGRKQQPVFRYRSLDPQERTIPLDKPVLLSANADATEANGFYLPDHALDHADEHVRRCRGRRLGVEHDQRVRRDSLGHWHVARLPVREDAEPHRSAAVGCAAPVHRKLADLLGRKGAHDLFKRKAAVTTTSQDK